MNMHTFETSKGNEKTKRKVKDRQQTETKDKFLTWVYQKRFTRQAYTPT